VGLGHWASVVTLVRTWLGVSSYTRRRGAGRREKGERKNVFAVDHGWPVTSEVIHPRQTLQPFLGSSARAEHRILCCLRILYGSSVDRDSDEHGTAGSWTWTVPGAVWLCHALIRASRTDALQPQSPSNTSIDLSRQYECSNTDSLIV
jgi:hypothetical protein